MPITFAEQAQRAERALSLGSLDQPPANFDPATMPIISRHWFGIKPFRPIGEVAAQVVADLRFRRQVICLHEQGPRVTAEMLAEIGAERGITTVIDRKVDTYVDLDPESLRATGGDNFWPVPVREVQGI